MPKVSFRMASASRESVFGVQTNTARKIHRSDHTEGRLTTAPSGCCVRKGTVTDNQLWHPGPLNPSARCERESQLGGLEHRTDDEPGHRGGEGETSLLLSGRTRHDVFVGLSAAAGLSALHESHALAAAGGQRAGAVGGRHASVNQL